MTISDPNYLLRLFNKIMRYIGGEPGIRTPGGTKAPHLISSQAHSTALSALLKSPRSFPNRKGTLHCAIDN